MNIDFEKLYKIARQKVGPLYADLVHISFEEMSLKKEKIHDPESHICKIMYNQIRWKNSKFNKLYRNKKKANFDVEECHLKDIDSRKVERIIEELNSEGFDLEIMVFKEYVKTGSVLAMSQGTEVTRPTLQKIINFVKNEIKSRYEH